MIAMDKKSISARGIFYSTDPSLGISFRLDLRTRVQGGMMIHTLRYQTILRTIHPPEADYLANELLSCSRQVDSYRQEVARMITELGASWSGCQKDAFIESLSQAPYGWRISSKCLKISRSFSGICRLRSKNPYRSRGERKGGTLTILKCDADDVLEIAQKLREADSEIRQILQALDVTVTEKGARWSGDSQRYFMQFFREWRRGMEIQSYAVRKTADQLHRAAEEYRRIPFDLPQRMPGPQS
jgi:WXG100 family type VII secretion target